MTAAAPGPGASPEVAVGEAERLLRRVQFTVLKRLDGILQGDYTGLWPGPGYELAEIREYQPGDEVRRIDWNVTARMNRTFIRETVEEREITVWLAVDLSGSMHFGWAGGLKSDLVTEFAALISFLFVRHGNKVALAGFTNRIDRLVPPRSGRSQAVRIVHELQTWDWSRPVPTDLAGVIGMVGRVLRRRSLVFLVSDFLGPNDWEAPFKLLALRHEVVPVRVQDPAEVEPPPFGLLRLQDPESGEQLWVDLSDRRLRRRLRDYMQAHRAEQDDIFRRCGVDVLDLSTDRGLLEPVLRFVSLRRGRKKGWSSSGRPRYPW
jgi:uncharacterized protein (DUF58 family)